MINLKLKIVCLSMSLSLYIHRGRRIFFKGFAILCCCVSTVAHTVALLPVFMSEHVLKNNVCKGGFI